jgi:hypothetical protein
MDKSGISEIRIKLDLFIRKFYKNLLIKGLLLSAGIIAAAVLFAFVLEFFGNFGTGVRTFFFFSLAGSILGVSIVYLISPLLKLNRIGNIISYEEASRIIGKHFPEVSDKLLNVLQLEKNLDHQSDYSADLVLGAIRQKTMALKPIPFSNAIDLKRNTRYLKYALPPVLVFIALLLFSPQVITGPAKRIVAFGNYFEKPAPFSFVLNSGEPLSAIQLEDFNLDLKLEGNEIPDQVFLEWEGKSFRMEKENLIRFRFTLKNIQKTTRFRFSGGGFQSREYELEVYPKPILLDFEVKAFYPKYLGKKDEVIKNTTDLLVPAGTRLEWNLKTKNTSHLSVVFQDSITEFMPKGSEAIAFSKRFLSDQKLTFKTRNEKVVNKDSMVCLVNVIPDQYPFIEVSEKRDSISLKKTYFSGLVKDDYGFSKLNFFFRKLDADGKPDMSEPGKILPIQISKNLNQEPFFLYWDLESQNLKPGDQIEYYFEVFDNDGVAGPKATRSQKQFLKIPGLDDLAKLNQKNAEETKKDLEESLKKSKEIQKELDALNKRLMDKKEISWDEKKKMQDLIEKQKELQKKVEEIKKENELHNKQQSEFQQPNESILEKQKELEKLFQSMMNEELKKKFEELQKLLDKLDKNELQKQLDQMKLDNKDLEKEMDRALEMFKQLQVDQKLENNIKKLEELSKKQEDLSKESENKNANKEELEKKQEELNKEFQEFRKDMDELHKMNQELERPKNLEDTDKQEEEIQQDQKNSSNQLNQGNSKGASKSQKKAGQQMKQLASQLAGMQSGIEMEQQEEDMNNLRQILTNLIQLSFDQEALMKKFAKVKSSDPAYVKNVQEQKKLKDDAKIIEDSLLALSKRVFQLQTTVNKEISAINMNMEKAIADFGERMTSSGMTRQQYVMTSLNNLALLLSEALNQMQQQMQSKSGSAGSCTKPGGKGQKPSYSTIRKMQQQLNQQIEELKKALENGQKPGNTGKTGQGGVGGMNEALVKLAAQQEALRKMMQQLMNEQGGNVPGDMKNTLKKMEETETDLVNKMVNLETMKRQQQILEKLLDYEKAEKQKDMEERRLAEQPKKEEFRNQKEFLEYNRIKQREAELLKTVPIGLKPFYKNKVTEYFNKFE